MENKKDIKNEEDKNEHPYPELFQEKERLLKKRMNEHILAG